MNLTHSEGGSGCPEKASGISRKKKWGIKGKETI